jgi:hypothetical protein
MDTTTWLDPEERAGYTGSLRNSRRRFRALCPDGVYRNGICGIADTYSTVPARLKVRGRTVSGFIMVTRDADWNSVIKFVPSGDGKHRAIFD